jgi:alpha-glucoside transport system substrate-binding protein
MDMSSARRARTTNRLLRLGAAVFALALIVSACGGDDDDSGGNSATQSTTKGQKANTGKVNLMSAGEPEETQAYQKIFDEKINAKVDYKVTVESVGNFEQQFQIRAKGGTLDVAAVPQPGAIPKLVDQGSIVSLEDMGFNIDDLKQTLGESFVELGAYKGKHYGIPTNINLKSMVWYPKKAFDAKGYKVPETWDDLLALSDQIKADGSTPWCVGFGSEGSTGWPATDWVEDIMLRTAGPETYDKWWKHEIPFNDPSVKTAAEDFGKIMFTDGYVLGGAKNTPSIAFGDAPLPMFQNPPKCWLHRQASFIAASFPTSAKAGVDYDWFQFPPIDQQGTLFGGELTVVGKNGNRPEVVDFLKRFLAEDVQCEMGGVAASSRISPNVDVKSSCYTNKILADASEILSKSLKDGTGRFDASDLMPAAVGSGSFWTGMVKYVQNGPSSLDGVLNDIENSWPKS